MNRKTLEEVLNRIDLDQLPIARSPAMRKVIDQAIRFAQSSAVILLTGESGTGKEVLARLIHQCSQRSQQPYVQVNGAALPDALFESELFGYERGAFTGALETRVGRFEFAGEGTILLDEIGEVSLACQASLLRALEEEQFERLGSNRPIRLQARIIAATNRDLQEDVQDGRFREDLYYRLDVLQIRIPPLRERPDDILPLAEFFMQKFAFEASTGLTGISAEAKDRLLSYHWPGNVRQLRNCIHRACVLADDHQLSADALGEFRDTDQERQTSGDIPITDMRLDEAERYLIFDNLERFNGNKTAVAKQLGVSARTLSNKMKRYREEGHLRHS